jgi:hypothetical protein
MSTRRNSPLIKALDEFGIHPNGPGSVLAHCIVVDYMHRTFA